MMYLDLLFYGLLLIVAFLYASVGHGGASGYLALMALFSFVPDTMRSTALILNVLVSGIAFIQYCRKGYFKWNLFWPFAITSIPAAFIGGMIHVDDGIYKKILAILLIFSVIKLLDITDMLKTPKIKHSILWSLIIGLLVGIFSGMIGIGGGIILSPLILMLHWADMKQTAAISSLFIFVNSISGLIGLSFNGLIMNESLFLMVMISATGGLLGSYIGASKLHVSTLKIILSMVLIIAAIKLLFT